MDARACRDVVPGLPEIGWLAVAVVLSLLVVLLLRALRLERATIFLENQVIRATMVR